MRVAHLLHALKVGGLERGVARLVNGLDRPAYEHLIISFDRSGEAARWLDPGAAELLELHKRPGNDPWLVWRLREALRRRRVDIVHSHNWGTLLETTLARRWAGVPAHVHGWHGAPPTGGKRRSLQGRLRARVSRGCQRRTEAVVAVSQSVCSQVAAWCRMPAGTIEVIPNGTDTIDPPYLRRARLAARDRLAVAPSATVIGSIGRLEPVKDFFTALAALEVSVRAGEDSHLLLVGQGSQGPALCREAASRQLGERLHIVSGELEMTPWLAAMDIYVNTSRSEGMSQGILEAMAAGLPLVVTAVGDSAHLVAGERPCGLVIAPADVGALAGALKELGDPERRAVFGTRARERHNRHYCTPLMVARYDRLYRRVAAGHPDPEL